MIIISSVAVRTVFQGFWLEGKDGTDCLVQDPCSVVALTEIDIIQTVEKHEVVPEDCDSTYRPRVQGQVFQVTAILPVKFTEAYS